VRLILATNHLGLGGSESYLLTVAEQLDRLGHEAFIFAPEPGKGVEVAEERGLAVVSGDELPEQCDAALVQDAAVALQLAGRYPETPQLFVAHSEIFDLQTPPQLPGAVAMVIALNDRVEARMRSLAVEVEVKRLRQPIDTERFVSRTSLPETPRRALLLSNTPVSDRLKMLEDACRSAGIELTRLGGLQGQTTDPRSALVSADIVIGYGRTILEGMACGRAAYVYDWKGGDGWITPQSYPAIEADGFGGRSAQELIDADRLAADLREYSAAMGPVNHDLVMANHRANVHTQELVQIFQGLTGPEERPRAPLDEMARLVRLEWRARAEVHALGREIAQLRDFVEEVREDANQRIEEHGEAVARGVRETFESSLSWRLTRPLRAATQALRRRRGRG
jgi:hypothetical protein